MILCHNTGAADILLCTYMNLKPGTISVSPLASSLPKTSPLSVPELKLIISWTGFESFVSITEEFQPQSQKDRKIHLSNSKRGGSVDALNSGSITGVYV